jgi:phosphoenolpyruvate---glycerone phosphotransferase subunit DhaL
MHTFSKDQGSLIVDNLIVAFQKNKQYLSDLDGLIGDGDHGINMNKGFTMAREELDRNPGDLVHGLKIISRILLMKIGGAMGPLYGKFFSGMAISLEGKDNIGLHEFGDSLEAVIKAIGSISPAKAGDKTLLDSLLPAFSAYDEDRKKGKNFEEALLSLKTASRNGLLSTRDMIAKIGRASRLGERSVGVLDPGAASCCLILETISDSIQEILGEKVKN